MLSRCYSRAELERRGYTYVYTFETIKYFLKLTGSIDNYTKLCTIEVDLSHLPLPPRPKYSGAGTIYYIEYDVVLLFGLTELQAMLAWKENVGPFLPLYCVVFFNSVSRALNDEVRPRFYMIQIPRPTAPNLLSTLSNFPPCDHIGPIHLLISHQSKSLCTYPP